MSCGTLPLEAYHRASQLGEGTFGSVVTVYNDDGREFALKLFETEEGGILNLGATREISILRLLRNQYGHANIIELVDIQAGWCNEDEAGAGTAGYLGMALPLYRMTLLRAIQGKHISSKSNKVKIAHGLLSAVAFLHDNGIIHRDIKCDNVLLDEEDNPVLIDFSLAKIVDTPMYGQGKGSEAVLREVTQHTGDVGTVTYTAPEVVEGESYGLPMDLWSVGVCLLELLIDQPLRATKNGHAWNEVETHLEALPDQPFPNLIRRLLERNPADRWTARRALESPLFGKFDLIPPPLRVLDFSRAFDTEFAQSDENESPRDRAKRLQRRTKTVAKLCRELEAEHPLTLVAALEYCQHMDQLEDNLDDLVSSQCLLDCVVLAHRFFEHEVLDLDDLSSFPSFKRWCIDDYIDNETTIFMMMEYCLYPRSIGNIADIKF